MKATFTVVLRDGKPWLRWDQYETTFLRIWKADSDRPYVKYNGLTVYLEEYMINQLREARR